MRCGMGRPAQPAGHIWSDLGVRLPGQGDTAVVTDGEALTGGLGVASRSPMTPLPSWRRASAAPRWLKT